MPPRQPPDPRAMVEVAKAVDYRIMFKSEEGQKCLRDLMVQSKYNDSLLNTKSDRINFINQGKRELFIYILNKLAFPMDPVALITQMQKELEDYGRQSTGHTGSEQPAPRRRIDPSRDEF